MLNEVKAHEAKGKANQKVDDLSDTIEQLKKQLQTMQKVLAKVQKREEPRDRTRLESKSQKTATELQIGSSTPKHSAPSSLRASPSDSSSPFAEERTEHPSTINLKTHSTSRAVPKPPRTNKLSDRSPSLQNGRGIFSLRTERFMKQMRHRAKQGAPLFERQRLRF